MKRIKGTLFLLTAVLTLTLAACGTPEPAPAPEDEAAAAQTENTESAVQFGAVKADGFLMDYFRFGEGEKTLVILPGLSVKSILLSAEGVAAGFRPYTEDYTTYVFDRPKDPPAGYSIRDLARDTAEAFDWLGLRDVDLYGASMGPMIGQVLAMERPDLVHKLVMSSTAARSGERSDGAMAAWIALAEQGDLEGLAARFGQDVYSEDFYRQYADQILASVEGADEEDLDRFSRTSTSTMTWIRSGARCLSWGPTRTSSSARKGLWRSGTSWAVTVTSTRAMPTPFTTRPRTSWTGSLPSSQSDPPANRT